MYKFLRLFEPSVSYISQVKSNINGKGLIVQVFDCRFCDSSFTELQQHYEECPILSKIVSIPEFSVNVVENTYNKLRLEVSTLEGLIKHRLANLQNSKEETKEQKEQKERYVLDTMRRLK